MTRFTRAKGSKASNERIPEQATSWNEMRQELLNKNKELEDKKNYEQAMAQRQANYQTFLKEKEKEDDKNISWADFPGEEKHKTMSKSRKHKLSLLGVSKDKAISAKSNFKTQKVKKMNQENGEAKFEASDEEFSILKSKIDKVLSNQNINDSDSDAPPEETSIKDKPPEIIVKKAKKPKQKLQILLNQKNQSESNNKMVKTDSQVKTLKNKVKKENLTDKDKRKIEKKQERYKKQLDKKKLKRNEKKINKDQTVDDNIQSNFNLNQSVTEKESTSSHSSEIDRKKLEKKLERRKRQKEKKLKRKQETELNGDAESNPNLNQSVTGKESTSSNSNEIDRKKLEKKLERRKRQKEKKLKKKQETELNGALGSKMTSTNLTEKDLSKIQKKKEKIVRQAEKRKKFNEAKKSAVENVNTSENVESESTGSINSFKNTLDKKFERNNNFQAKYNKNEDHNFKVGKPLQKHLNKQKEKKVKIKDKKDFKRNKPKAETMIINGRSIEIDYVDGFPVKKEDAERLKKLRKEMISKGLPRSEINIALKLERRRAEKAFAREKKNVCFNCRKSGHNLSECPELGKDQVAQTSGTGICFKCGSTEHTHFECKVVKGQEYKFATCFICKEQGHISRQCPDNQRGLYPKGGSCNVCGDVTHLKKDCPKYQAQQAQLKANLSIETIDNRNPDDLDSNLKSKYNLEPVKRLNIKIKF